MKQLFITLSLCCVTTISPTPSHALPSGWSTSTYNGMTVIIDPVSGIQWLPPIYSTNISFNAMLLHLEDTDSPYYGFRYASSHELLHLYDAYGFVANSYAWPPPAANHEPALEFQRDFGVTRVLEGNQLNTLGIISDPQSGTAQCAGEVTIFLELFSPSVQAGAIASTQAWVLRDTAMEGWGSYLIRSVPAPPVGFPEIRIPPINLRSKGRAVVTILSTERCDATSIDPSSVRFARAAAIHHSYDDVDRDGDPDLQLHFNIRDLALASADTGAVLTGQTYEGTRLESMVTVRIVP